MPLYEGIGLINEKLPVVLEIGNALTKAGFAGEHTPRVILPSSVSLVNTTNSDSSKAENVITLHNIKDENELYLALVEFLNKIYFGHLLVTPKDRKVVILESLFTPTKWRNTLARVLYIHYEVLNILWVPTHLAATVGVGADTALVVDIGQGEANVIPVVHGVTLLSTLLSYELGAAAFDANLKELLVEHALDKKEGLSDLLRSALIEDIRVRSCFVAPMNRAKLFKDKEIHSLEPKLGPFNKEISENEFQIFDGVVREIAPEIWFQTSDLDGVSIPQMILDVIGSCPIDCRKTLAGRILVCGGTSMLPGFQGRLIRELKKLALERECYSTKLNGYDFRILQPPLEPNCASWFGGSVYGSSEAMGLRGISKEYFLKNGTLPDWSSSNFSHSYTPFGVPNPSESSSSAANAHPAATSRRI